MCEESNHRRKVWFVQINSLHLRGKRYTQAIIFEGNCKRVACELFHGRGAVNFALKLNKLFFFYILFPTTNQMATRVATPTSSQPLHLILLHMLSFSDLATSEPTLYGVGKEIHKSINLHYLQSLLHMRLDYLSYKLGLRGMYILKLAIWILLFYLKLHQPFVNHHHSPKSSIHDSPNKRFTTCLVLG